MRKLTKTEQACLSASARHPNGYLMYDQVQRKAADALVKLGLVTIKDGEYPYFGRVLAAHQKDSSQ